MNRSYFIALLIALAGCPDPVREELEEAQGPEAAGVRPGPNHRPGQVCLACHREGGEGPEFSFAGTVYARQGENEPAVQIEIAVRDTRGDERTLISNGAGNFWMPTSDWKPLFPLRAELHVDGKTLLMHTEIPREGSCNKCHRGAGDTSHMPGIYVEAASQ